MRFSVNAYSSKMNILLFFTVFTYVSKSYADQCGLATGGAIIQEISNGSVQTSSGLFYDSDDDKLYFTERDKPALWVIDGKTAEVERFPIDGLVSFIAVIPVKKNKDLLIGLADNKMIYLLLQRDKKTGKILSIKTQEYKVLESDPTMVFTYSKVDKNGRIFIDVGFNGTFSSKPVNNINGKVIQMFNQKESAMSALSDLKYPEGIGFSSDFKNLFQADIKSNLIWKYKYDVDKGTVGDRKVVFNLTAEMTLEGILCSLAVTKNNELWIGLCESGTVLLYNWEKKIYQQIHQIPAQYPIWLEMGGPDLSTLFVATEAIFNEDTPSKGSVFAISGTGVKGQPSYKVPSS